MSQKTQTEENVKRVQRQLRDLREEFSDAQKKEMEVSQKNKELVSTPVSTLVKGENLCKSLFVLSFRFNGEVLTSSLMMNMGFCVNLCILIMNNKYLRWVFIPLTYDLMYLAVFNHAEITQNML